MTRKKRPCPKCGGWYVRQIEVGCARMMVNRCLICGFRHYPSGPIPDEDSHEGALALIAVVGMASKVDHVSLPLVQKVAVDQWNEEWKHIPPPDFEGGE